MDLRFPGQANSHTSHLGNKGWGNDPGFISPARGRRQWNTHQVSVGHALGFSGASVEHAPGFSGGVGLWVGVVWSSPGRRLTFSGKILGNSRARRKILGVICREFWEFRDFCTRVHQSRPEKRRDLSHVTQPRARINVSCSRADHK